MTEPEALAKPVLEYLEGHGVDFIRHDHPPVFTCEESDKYCQNIPGLHTKNLFLRNKNKSSYYLVVLPAKKRADLKKLCGIFEESKLSFGSPESLFELLGLTPGSVSPFGLINDQQARVKAYVDVDVISAEIVGFHPNTNTATLELTKEMFQRYLDSLPHQIEVVEV